MAFGVGEVNGFTVRTLGCEACDAGFSEADGMAGDCCCVEVFGDGVEETDSWNVDSRGQWAVGVIFGVKRGAAV